MQRVIFRTSGTAKAFLTGVSPAEKFFIEKYGADVTKTTADPTSSYYKFDKTYSTLIADATIELHSMCMKATGKVIQSDDLLTRFGVDQKFWPKIRKSWETQRNWTLTGRFDFAVAPNNVVKMFEYNADSAGTLFECAYIQHRWANAVGVSEGSDAGAPLETATERGWAALNIPKGTIVHFLIDDDPEELYNALYMQEIAAKTGVVSKLCQKTSDLRVDGDGTVRHKDGEVITHVWKMWMWETIFRRDQPFNAGEPSLQQIFLNDAITVIEPLWKVITSNKALLVVLWEMFPNHPHLLRTEWQLTPELTKTGYARKPIVGRCGYNVALFPPGHSSHAVEENAGNFGDRAAVYQEMVPLPHFHGCYPTIGSWVVGEGYGGFGLREDNLLITSHDSPYCACRIMP
eukprot:PhF_6_TR12927/c0_g1_i1/m.20396/K01460/gsp; glutathionylspermidine amidase/synthetase